MTYRDDARETLLRERCASLETELAEVKARRDAEKSLRSREEELRAELARLRIDLAQTDRKLPLLASVRVASPCSAKWEAMVGDEKSRFCGSCQKHVHNLSAMSALEAEALLQRGQETNGALCVRYFQRADGTIMTQDCPVGVRRKRLRRFAALAIGAGAAGAAVASYLTTLREARPCPVATEVAVAGGLNSDMSRQGLLVDSTAPSTQPSAMGSAVPIVPPPPPHEVMGRRAAVAGGIRFADPPAPKPTPKKPATAQP